jgi:hypothetical protein
VETSPKRHSRSVRLVLASSVLVAALIAVGGGWPTAIPSTTNAAAAQVAPVGFDVSFPQCDKNGTHYPSNAAFAIVGVNGGWEFVANHCLGRWHGQAGELAWANGVPGLPTQPRLSFYVIAGDPGPGASGWPSPSTRPQKCDGTWSWGCAYDYGYARAADSLHLARLVASLERLSHRPIADPLGEPWWLDVETDAHWATAKTPGWISLNIGALVGFVDALEAGGMRADQIGFYSTGYQWRQITGLNASTSHGYFLLAHPDWVPGSKTLEEARAACNPAKSFSGGHVMLTQFRSGDFDADYRCP